MKESRTEFTLRVPDDLMPFINTVSKSLSISRNAAINLIIRQYLNEHPEPEDEYLVPDVSDLIGKYKRFS